MRVALHVPDRHGRNTSINIYSWVCRWWMQWTDCSPPDVRAPPTGPSSGRSVTAGSTAWAVWVSIRCWMASCTAGRSGTELE